MKLKFTGFYILPNGNVYNREIVADITEYFECLPDGDDMIIRVREESIIVHKDNIKVEIV